MRAVIQRVKEASVLINGIEKRDIQAGLLVLVGIEENDSVDDAEWLASKIVQMRIFGDANGLMNLSLQDIGGSILIISQFTLHASTRKGNRPSFIRAAKPVLAEPLYHRFIGLVKNGMGKEPVTGEFGADMQVSLVNDGPVTIWIDTKNKE
jgi:D-aminoacyl-tRNA deacylase